MRYKEVRVIHAEASVDVYVRPDAKEPPDWKYKRFDHDWSLRKIAEYLELSGDIPALWPFKNPPA